MNSKRYRTVIEAIGLSQVAAAKFVGVAPRSSRRWAAGDAPIPDDVAVLLSIMAKHQITPEEARGLIGLPWPDVKKPPSNLALGMLLEAMAKYKIAPDEARKRA